MKTRTELTKELMDKAMAKHSNIVESAFLERLNIIKLVLDTGEVKYYDEYLRQSLSIKEVNQILMLNGCAHQIPLQV